MDDYGISTGGREFSKSYGADEYDSALGNRSDSDGRDERYGDESASRGYGPAGT